MEDTNTSDETKTKVGFDVTKIIFAIVAIVIVGVLIFMFGFTQKEDTSTYKGGDVMEDSTKVVIEDIEVGDGVEAVAGKSVTVHYTGMLIDGTKFDSSLDRGTPFTFELGAGRVIQGWEQGVPGMKVGGKRKLTIPSDLGYGSTGTPDGSIPPNATLVFEVELLDVE